MNVFDYLFDSTRNLEKDFVLGPKETISFKKLHEDSLKIASYLKLNVGINQNIVLISPNSVFFITAYLGILKSGNVCVPLNFSIEQENLDFIIKTTNCKSVFIAKTLQSKQEFSDKIQTIDEVGLNKIISNQGIVAFDFNLEKNSLAEIIFTSGSSGMPKGVMISHQNIISNTQSIIEYLSLTTKDVIGIVLPFFYCYGLSLLHTHLRVGGSIVLNNSFIFLGSVINDLKNYKCTGFAGVPSHYQILLKKSQNFKNTDFPDLRYVTQAGGKLHDVFIDEFVEAFPKIEFFVMYGQTEATARLSYLPPHLVNIKKGSIGKAIPGVILKVLGVDGKDVVTGEVGEIVAKGDNVMKGYLDDTKETSQVLKDGWLYTGDLGVMDNEGFIYLTSRKKEIMKIGGHRISPKEIEEVIVSISEVVDCTVVAIDDELLGEAIKAIIVINEETDKNYLKSKVINLCRSRLSPNKTPHLIEFVLNLKVSSSGKKIKDQSIN